VRRTQGITPVAATENAAASLAQNGIIHGDDQRMVRSAKPHPRAPQEQHEAYRVERAARNINLVGRERLASLRRQMDDSGSAARRLIATVDGRFTNATVLRQIPERIVLVGRVRKDSAFYDPPASQPQRRRKGKCGLRCPTPEVLLKDPTVPWQTGQGPCRRASL
jgi:hypothetical protein